ncbi:ribosome maturation factor RimM [Porphyrobacter sp. CACIAM 03H1]|uniref:ribosome maturation factor RimM n=1 Tax=Porphyrobacter sp. CACIAM 03H1 TaxID=2003315 RepID=UPI000B5A4C0B|nr:ribosome maturation factor RimM [Porphyrobacter sp. CACIAM 03H1]ASJ91542.1 16S rRNA processing protein RimM [Porphyrobacter sp. CACIAM 03H1]
MTTTKPVTLAAIAGAHGVAGEVRLKLFGDGIATLAKQKSFNDGALTLVKIREDGKGGAIARLAESTSRADAEKLRGTVLTVPREALPPLAEGEFYHADLLGLPVVTDAGDAVGTVLAIENFGATDIVEIALDPAPAKGPKTFMVPMIPAAVIEWDDKRLVISADFADN